MKRPFAPGLGTMRESNIPEATVTLHLLIASIHVSPKDGQPHATGYAFGGGVWHVSCYFDRSDGVVGCGRARISVARGGVESRNASRNGNHGDLRLGQSKCPWFTD